MAKYDACIFLLRLSIDMNVQELLVIGDSDLLVHQVLGEWATKSTKILPYLHCVHDLINRFTKIEFKHAPRIQNEFADALATLSFMIQHPYKNFIDLIPYEIRKQSAYCAHVEENFDRNPWFHDIKEYLEKGEYLENATHTQKRTLQRLVHADMIRVPPNELNATSSPWPFSAWGMDIIGPIEPAASNGYRFILVDINYFTKCVEAASYKVVTKKIKHQNSTAYMLQMNGAVEAANKNIKKILRKMVDNYKQWHEKLPFALL
ncbi:uncharacterized protein [Nicotiana tomentosiformis]|uniref:uncharacterized protein n=1 Tax=Nicotiana tomentosiformis TaxID=4098 RepID=UPI00388C8C9C